MQKLSIFLTSTILALVVMSAAEANTGDFTGGVAVGSSYAGVDTAPTNGLLVQGDVGFGTSSPINALDISGAAVIGSSYAGTDTAPSNGLLVQGKVGIGTTSVSDALDVAGAVGLTTTASPPANGMYLSGTNTLGFATDGALAFQINSSGAVDTGVWHGTAIGVAYGGTGDSSFTSNGVLYGNGTGALQATVQGGANSVLTANNGAPSFSTSPTIGTSVTTPLVIGGTGASSTLTLESTSTGGTSDSIIFKTGSQSTAMTITTTGYVGIATTSPSTPLDVNGPMIVGGNTQYAPGTNTGILQLNSTTTSGNGPQVDMISWGNQSGWGGNFGAFHSRGGSVGTQGAVQSGDELGGIVYGGSDGSVLAQNAGIFGYAAAAWTTSSHPTYLVFYTAPSGAGAGALTEQMRITSAGNVGIGTTTPGQKLEVNGEVQIDSFASASGTTVCRNGSVLSSCSSSIRYKERVKPAAFGLKEVMEMRPITFKWKGRDEDDFGLVAEDVEKVNPLFVTYERGQIEGVKYPQLTAVLIKAVQQQQEQFAEQQAEIDQLKRKIEQLTHQK
jgi:endosialidase-like protein